MTGVPLMTDIRRAETEDSTARLAMAVVVGVHEATHPSDEAMISRIWRAEDWLEARIAEHEAKLAELSRRHLAEFGVPLPARTEYVADPHAVDALAARALGVERIVRPGATSAVVVN